MSICTATAHILCNKLLTRFATIARAVWRSRPAARAHRAVRCRASACISTGATHRC
jgi:hypothetical protein